MDRASEHTNIERAKRPLREEKDSTPRELAKTNKLRYVNRTWETYGNHRYAWVNTHGFVWTVMIYPDGTGGVEIEAADELAHEYLMQPEVELQITPSKRQTIKLKLTGMSTDELDAVRKVLNIAIDEAQAATREMDRIARLAWENGDDSYSRLYRQVPEVFVRPRVKSGDSKGSKGRPYRLVEVDGEGPREDDEGGLEENNSDDGGLGGAVYNGDALEVVSEDDA